MPDLKATAPAMVIGGRDKRDARGGDRAHGRYSKLSAQRQFPPLRVRGQRFADLCEALGFERNAALSDNREYRSGRRGSFVADLPSGRWYDHQADIGGAAVELVIHTGVATDFPSAVDWLRAGHYADGALDLKRDVEREAQAAERAPLDAEAKALKARSIWCNSSPITPNNLGGRYLLARAIAPSWPMALRFSARVWNSEARRNLPALVAAVTPLGAPDDVRAVHRTWLSEPGRKADLSAPKKALGAIAGCGVILGDIADEIVIAEGIESALSAGHALELSALATLGASNMRRLIVPPHVRRVVIAADRDGSGEGESAARDLGAKLVARGVSVALAWPPKPFADWNAAACAGGLTHRGDAHV
jgi:hypothetical protein